MKIESANIGLLARAKRRQAGAVQKSAIESSALLMALFAVAGRLCSGRRGHDQDPHAASCFSTRW
jgi:hypothetical protein